LRRHPAERITRNVTSSGSDDSRVSGTVFEVIDAELFAADEYERRAPVRPAEAGRYGRESSR
jgi:hypothetical protein